jgi:hypothetical protein
MPDNIKIMISSRCKDKVKFNGVEVEMSELRKKIKDEIQAEKLFGEHDLFEVWINEDAPPQEGSSTAWDVCMEQVDKANVLLVLFNGNAGWSKEPGGIGICHAEMSRAMEREPAKVRCIKLPLPDPNDPNAIPLDSDTAARNDRFFTYIEQQGLFAMTVPGTVDDLISLVKETLHDVLLNMAEMSKREARKGKFFLGEALSWSNKDFLTRKDHMEKVMRDFLIKKTGTVRKNSQVNNDPLLIEMKSRMLFSIIHAVPASLSTAAARELVGRPFLNDHKFFPEMENKNEVGPFHFIGCYKKASETQALNLIGHPDVTVINAPFGIYLADLVQFIQVVFLNDCRDSTSTRNAMQRFFDWISQSNESQNIVLRAEKRKKIIKTVYEVSQ